MDFGHVFREYDIRGIAGQELTPEFAHRLGVAFAAHLRATLPDLASPRVAVGRDGRLSSPSLAQALMAGLTDSGLTVLEVGLVPTPALYFAAHHLESAAGIMLTGSHNPPDYNGFKMVRGGLAIYGAEIQAIRARFEALGADRPQLAGRVTTVPILETYLDRLVADFTPGRPLKVVFDCGNGATGVATPGLMQRLARHGVSGEVMYAEVDGTFPNHHPDPTLPKTLQGLRTRMQESGAEVGIAFDGDGDRIGVLNDQGEILWGDRLLLLFAQAVLRDAPGSVVIGDVKCSQVLFDAVREAGGQPLMWKCGHSLVKAKMKETGAPLAGEMSGHIFFAHRYLGFDDALYAAVRLLELLAAEPTPLSARLTHVPTLHATPELRIPCPEKLKWQVMERIAEGQRRAKADLSDVDGVRVRVPGGWWLVRVSNTQPVLVARVEADSPTRLAEITDELAAILAREGVSLAAAEDH